MFENTKIVERFLNYWRTTGHQRMGYLYGTYEQHTDVPLGIRAKVAAIYEPPQESTRDSINIQPDEGADDVDAVAAALGLKKVSYYCLKTYFILQLIVFRRLVGFSLISSRKMRVSALSNRSVASSRTSLRPRSASQPASCRIATQIRVNTPPMVSLAQSS